MELRGLGGPGSGYVNTPLGGMDSWMRSLSTFGGADGYGLGPYGYPLAFGGVPWSQQNMMLNQQWGWPNVGRYIPGQGYK